MVVGLNFLQFPFFKFTGLNDESGNCFLKERNFQNIFIRRHCIQTPAQQDYITDDDIHIKCRLSFKHNGQTRP